MAAWPSPLMRLRGGSEATKMLAMLTEKFKTLQAMAVDLTNSEQTKAALDYLFTTTSQALGQARELYSSHGVPHMLSLKAKLVPVLESLKEGAGPYIQRLQDAGLNRSVDAF